ncbi:MAG: hypothetical protein ACERKN_02820 [Velocimicrobium sp.]
MDKFRYIKNYFLKIIQVEEEMKKYSTEEIQYVESQKLETNIVRIQLVSIIIIIFQILHLISNMVTKESSFYAKWYFESEIAMIIVIVFHEIFYRYCMKRVKKMRDLGNKYVMSWYFCVSSVTMIFLVIDVIEKRTFFNFFVLTALITVVPLMKTKMEAIYSVALCGMQLVLLLFKDAKPRKYQLSFLFIAASFLIGRILYVDFVRSNVLKLRLDTAINELKLQKERFTILQNLTQETVFEYSFREDKMMITTGKGNETKVIYNYIQKLKHKYLSSEYADISEIIHVYQEIMYGKKKEHIEVHYKDKTGTMKNSRIVFTTIYDGNDPARLIGKIYKCGGGSSSMKDLMKEG